jgi:hypothetical protein
MLQKFADDEKTEQMANDKRRMRVQAHKKAVEDLIVKRREERASAKAAEVADINDQKERERLLRETIAGRRSAKPGAERSFCKKLRHCAGVRKVCVHT